MKIQTRIAKTAYFKINSFLIYNLKLVENNIDTY